MDGEAIVVLGTNGSGEGGVSTQLAFRSLSPTTRIENRKLEQTKRRPSIHLTTFRLLCGEPEPIIPETARDATQRHDVFCVAYEYMIFSVATDFFPLGRGRSR